MHLGYFGDVPHQPDSRGLIERVASALYERFEDNPEIEEWSQSVQDFYALHDVGYQVGNGGFAQAAFNVPELLPIAEDAYRRFGWLEAARLCLQTIEMLPEKFRFDVEKGIGVCPDLEEVFEHFDESPMEWMRSLCDSNN